MKKILLTSALSFVLAAPVWAMDAGDAEEVTQEQLEMMAAEMPPESAPLVESDAAAIAEDIKIEVETTTIKETTVETTTIETPEKTMVVTTVETANEEQPVAPVMSGSRWSYGGATAAPYWATLDAGYEVCGNGNMQSPINIAKFLQEDLPNIVPAYKPSPLSVKNTGNTIEVNFQPGSGFSTDTVNYSLNTAQFHTPSEHYLDGAPYPMELQFMHRTGEGHYGVISVMIKLGAHNPVVEGIWQNTPIEAGGEKTVDTVEISAADLMPQSLDYYRYEGSLTTPPCTEGVRWHVLKEPIEVSEKQLKAFQALFPVNARSVQDLNDRVVSGD